ncbi:toxin-antitoxin system TumE family protein [Runella slithyformis]|uniref:Uncharacterized protein n=1 Tax=Runella slithyformis (strain ATCC 29530 / DSM 19594 / LMG 11500 / NCIMB 11436 / LSU 4) TaxID=761193 RepID=A0A7U3ZLI7_RUNSL|nr:DUF6516 family protein [Runella slithyformis]AEI49418.1 hypothetical protein Runsl_3033 [Runella slithyformis DSM 19594]
MPLPDLAAFDAIITKSILIKELITPRIPILRYKVELVTGSILYAKEVTFFEETKIDYAYQWQRPDASLILRWDNAHDYPNLSTSPFHKHVGSETNVLPSEPMTIEKVLAYISLQISAT